MNIKTDSHAYQLAVAAQSWDVVVDHLPRAFKATPPTYLLLES